MASKLKLSVATSVLPLSYCFCSTIWLRASNSAVEAPRYLAHTGPFSGFNPIAVGVQRVSRVLAGLSNSGQAIRIVKGESCRNRRRAIFLNLFDAIAVLVVTILELGDGAATAGMIDLQDPARGIKLVGADHTIGVDDRGIAISLVVSELEGAGTFHGDLIRAAVGVVIPCHSRNIDAAQIRAFVCRIEALPPDAAIRICNLIGTIESVVEEIQGVGLRAGGFAALCDIAIGIVLIRLWIFRL